MIMNRYYYETYYDVTIVATAMSQLVTIVSSQQNKKATIN